MKSAAIANPGITEKLLTSRNSKNSIAESRQGTMHIKQSMKSMKRHFKMIINNQYLEVTPLEIRGRVVSQDDSVRADINRSVQIA